MKTAETDVVVIGGGAAGMIAAITAAERGRHVVLLEHEKFCGRKLRITGKGRCNVCNACEIKAFLQNVPQNPKFLYSALNRFTPRDTMAFFEESGVPLKVERGNRVFPVSDNAHDVANALEKRMRRAGVRVLIAQAEESEVHRLHPGDVFSVHFEESGAPSCEATVTAISPLGSSGSDVSTFEVRLAFTAPEGVWPGMHATLER